MQGKYTKEGELTVFAGLKEHKDRLFQQHASCWDRAKICHHLTTPSTEIREDCHSPILGRGISLAHVTFAGSRLACLTRQLIQAKMRFLTAAAALSAALAYNNGLGAFPPWVLTWSVRTGGTGALLMGTACGRISVD